MPDLVLYFDLRFSIYMNPTPTTIAAGKAILPDASYDPKEVDSKPQ